MSPAAAALALALLLAGVAGTPALAAGPAASVPAASLSLVDLGTLGGDVSQANDVNGDGTVVGSSQLADGSTHAFLWRDGQMRDLGTLGGVESVAYAVNDGDQVVGASSTAAGDTHAFLWQDGHMRDLGTFGRRSTSVAVDVNGAGKVLVYLGLKPPPVIWRPEATPIKVRVDGAALTLATALNDHAQVVGRVNLAAPAPGEADEQGFLWDHGRTTLLGTLGGGSSIAAAVNRDGEVAGWSLPAGSDRPHAFLWRAGTMSDLGTLNGTESFATGINVHTTVVGYIFRADLSRTRAFRWRRGTMIDLGVLDPTSAADTRANAVNDHGWIVGSSGAPAGWHAVLWRPV
jgi:probable HAF family extracellular repeat protein